MPETIDTGVGYAVYKIWNGPAPISLSILYSVLEKSDPEITKDIFMGVVFARKVSEP